MYRFSVPDMTCGHCVSTIRKALKTADPSAEIEVSLSDRTVSVGSRLTQAEVARRIAEAGYSPGVLV